MAWVWDQDIERDEKFVLLAYADHADHDGNNIYPAVDKIARKTGYSERSIQRITRQLVEHGWLIAMGTSNRQTNKFSMPIYRGDKMTPPTDGGTQEADLRGDKMTGGDKNDTEGVTNLQGGVTNATQRGDIAVSPEPSLTVIKPLINRKDSGAKRPRDERLSHPAIVIYRDVAKLQVPEVLRDDVISTVGDDAIRWGNIVKQWIGNGWKPGNINGMLEYYRNGGNSNGHKNSKQSARDELYALTQED